MSPEKQRIAIAEVCGIQDPIWVADGLLRNKFSGWVGPDDNTGRQVNVPDYLNDLNAMHEAEKVLTPDQQARYAMTLHEMHGIPLATFWHRVICSTAAQRAEAFLRTVRKWEESP